MVPDYVEKRIRRPAPTDSSVVPGSTPVIAFGNARTAQVATLGLNPSRVEFLGKDGELLSGDERRLATHSSLGTSDLELAPLSVVSRVLDDCDSYFHRRPYGRWFGRFGATLSACGVCYRDGSACHLDSVQWATDPVWGKLQPRSLRRRLAEDDARFLAQQLRRENIRLLLVNGRGVLRELARSMGGDLVIREARRVQVSDTLRTALLAGRLFGRVKVVGWSTNLQSARGVTGEFCQKILPKHVAAYSA